MRIMIACRAIDKMAGGVERQATALANEMALRGHQVSLLTLDLDNAESFYDINTSVKWYKVGLGDPKFKAGLGLRLKRMVKIRRIMKDFKPDVVVGFQNGIFASLLLYTLGLRLRLVGAERESLDRYRYVKYTTSPKLVFAAYFFSSKITVQCPSYVQEYPWYLRSKIVVIPNAIRAAPVKTGEPLDAAEKNIILCVGRLTYQKNQQVLLDAFSQIHQKYPDWTVSFVGDGENRDALITKARNLGVENKIEFVRATKNISEHYHRASFLCIPSYWEGFPNVLGEAFAHSLPAVGYEDCGGVCDLIQHGENGLLAAGNGDITSLKEALETMMSDKALRERMVAASAPSVLQYAPTIIYDQWENLFKMLRIGKKTTAGNL